MPMPDYWDRSPHTHAMSTTVRSQPKNEKVLESMKNSEKHAIAEEIFAVRKQLSDNVYLRIMEILAKQ